ncbi:hypothetical protein OH76DRAFT_1504670 [Lentinus brumalis]|uniref:Uncharacterized protein n=1 Tax=Lentinus brumalis TaxID=2498619 RepID=A0A371DFW5_9APHY|nr:hypothetical protein OH76DRAFT_1504670 [Polyporus brumalis]
MSVSSMDFPGILQLRRTYVTGNLRLVSCSTWDNRCPGCGLRQMSSSPPSMLLTPTTTMSSSSTPSTSSTDHSFFSNPRSSTLGSSTVVKTRLIPATRPPDPRAGAPTIKVTAYSPPAVTTSRDADASPKRKCEDPVARKAVKKRRVSPLKDAGNVPQSLSRASSLSAAPSPVPSGSSRQSSLAPTYLSTDTLSPPSTRATSVASVGPPAGGPPRECWIEEGGTPGPGFLSSEIVVQRLMKGYISCKCSVFLLQTAFSLRRERRSRGSVPHGVCTYSYSEWSLYACCPAGMIHCARGRADASLSYVQRTSGCMLGDGEYFCCGSTWEALRYLRGQWTWNTAGGMAFYLFYSTATSTSTCLGAHAQMH